MALIALKGHTFIFSVIFYSPSNSSPLHLFWAIPLGHSLTWIMYEQEGESENLCGPSVCLCVCLFSTSVVSIFFSLGYFFFNLKLSVSVSCSEVCRLWPRSGEIWMQQPIWLPDRGRRSSLCCQEHSALCAVCTTVVNQGQWHHHPAAMGDSSQADACHTVRPAGEYILSPSITFLTCFLIAWLILLP